MDQQPFRGSQFGVQQPHLRPQRPARWSENQTRYRPYENLHRPESPSFIPQRLRGEDQREQMQADLRFPNNNDSYIRGQPSYNQLHPNYAVQQASNNRQPNPNSNHQNQSYTRQWTPNRNNDNGIDRTMPHINQQPNTPVFGQRSASEGLPDMLPPSDQYQNTGIQQPSTISPHFTPHLLAAHPGILPQLPRTQPPIKNQFSTPPPNYRVPPPILPKTSQQNKEEKMKDSSTKTDWQSDIILVKQWLERRKPSHDLPAKSPKNPSIPEAQKLFKEAIEVFKEFKEEKQLLGSCLISGDHNILQKHIFNISTLKEKFNVLQKKISSNGPVLKRKLDAIKKKRIRLKRRKETITEENKERDIIKEAINKKIDAWRNEIFEKELQKKRDKDVKKAADETLAEVRKKLSDANKSLELLKALSKLRSARKDSMSSKGLYTPKEVDDNFEQKSEKLVEMLNKQLAVYEAERKTLQVMLDIEQEANLEKERELLKVREELRQQREENKINLLLFGKEDIPDDMDPIQPYRQYYQAADHDINALIHIRQTWDMYLVPSGTTAGTNIPQSWVIPVEPSSDTWASTLSSS